MRNLKVGAHGGKTFRFAMKVQIVAGRQTDGLETRIGIPDFDERRWIGVWERPKQDRLNHAEDCGVRADAKGERDDRNRSESGCLTQCAKSESHIVGEIAEPACFGHVPPHTRTKALKDALLYSRRASSQSVIKRNESP